MGFTIIELLVAVAILGILAALILVAINPAKRVAQSRDSQRKNDLGVLARTLDNYYVEHEEYPDPGADLFGESSESGDWIPGIVSGGYLKQLPKDPRQAGLINFLAGIISNFKDTKQVT